MKKRRFDLAIIGAGPGGYVAAIRAAQRGRKVALIDRGEVGGTCLNVGCIPSKALLSSALMWRRVRWAEKYGIEVVNPSFDYAKVEACKDRAVRKIRGGLMQLLLSNGIAVVRGSARFVASNTLKIEGEEEVEIAADAIIIATGSEPLDLPAFPCDHERIYNSTSAMELKRLPKSIVVIGGGYIGCEFASLFASFGVKVTIVEALPKIVQEQGNALSSALTQALIDRGVEIHTGEIVEGIERREAGVAIRMRGGKVVESEKALVAIGRRLNTKNLDLEKIGLSVDKREAIEVDEGMRTAIPGVYAIGDVTARAMLAHAASHQGVVAVSNICGERAQMDYRAIPSVIFTDPEIASVGMTKERAEEEGHAVAVGRFPCAALGKAIATMETEGFAEIVSDKVTGEILGAQVVGCSASSLIAEMALAIANELTLDCVVDTIHAHPTFSEIWPEAALVAQGTPLHIFVGKG